MRNSLPWYFWPFSAGLLAGIPFLEGALWPLSLMAMALLLYGLRKETKHARAFFSGIMFGVAISGCGVIWLWHTLPLDWLVNEAWQGYALVLFSWSTATLALALPAGLFAVAVRILIQKNEWYALAIPVLWAAVEYTRMWCYALLTLAPNSLFGPHFSFGAIGYPLAENPLLLQAAYPLGIYGLSFVVACTGTAVYLFLSRKKHAVVSGLLLIAAAGTVIGYGVFHEAPQSKEIPIALFATQTALRPADTQERIAAYKSLLSEAAHAPSSPRLIVMPEGYGLESLFTTQEERDSFIRETFGSQEVLIVSSGVTRRTEGDTLDILFFETQRGEIGRSEKTFLTPQGESIPYFTRLVASLLGSQKLLENIERKNKIIRGNAPTPATLADGTVVNALFCAEIASPLLYKTSVTDGASQILVNLTSHAWFSETRTVERHVLWMAKVHAVQNRLPFLLAGNHSPSFILDARGNIVASTARGEEKILYTTIQVR